MKKLSIIFVVICVYAFMHSPVYAVTSQRVSVRASFRVVPQVRMDSDEISTAVLSMSGEDLLSRRRAQSITQKGNRLLYTKVIDE